MLGVRGVPQGRQPALTHADSKSKRLGTNDLPPCWVVNEPGFLRLPIPYKSRIQNRRSMAGNTKKGRREGRPFWNDNRWELTLPEG